MVATAPRIDPRLHSRPDTRESRIRFPNRAALCRGLARARREPWIASCQADWIRLELRIHMRGAPAPRPVLTSIPGGRTQR